MKPNFLQERKEIYMKKHSTHTTYTDLVESGTHIHWMKMRMQLKRIEEGRNKKKIINFLK